MTLSEDGQIARRVGLRFVLWGCVGVFAVSSVLFGGPHNAAWFAWHIPFQILGSVGVLLAIVWFAAPPIAPYVVRWGALIASPVTSLSFLASVAVGSVLNVALSVRPNEPEPVHDYFFKPMFWFAILGIPIAAAFGAFLRRALLKRGYSAGAA